MEMQLSAIIFRLSAVCVVLLITSCTVVPTNSHINKWATNSAALSLHPVNGKFRAGQGVPWFLPDWCLKNVDINALNAAYLADKTAFLETYMLGHFSDRKWNWHRICSDVAQRNEGAGNADSLDTALTAMAVSGGGARSAIFAAAVMFELKKFGVMEKVDVISSVSGGSMVSALYAISCAPEDTGCAPAIDGKPRPVWQKDMVFDVLSQNLEWGAYLRLMRPDRAFGSLFTYYDRADVMAETMQELIYSSSDGHAFTFKDLNPKRPNLWMGATRAHGEVSKYFSDENLLKHNPKKELGAFIERYQFVFRPEQFQKIASNFADYPISHAVMASSAVPGIFQPITLANLLSRSSASEAEFGNYIHLLDGGVIDNSGLLAISQLIDTMSEPALNSCNYSKTGSVYGYGNYLSQSIVSFPGVSGCVYPKTIDVIQVDATIFPEVVTAKPDIRDSPFAYLIDRGAGDSIDVMMTINHMQRIEDFANSLERVNDNICNNPWCTALAGSHQFEVRHRIIAIGDLLRDWGAYGLNLSETNYRKRMITGRHADFIGDFHSTNDPARDKLFAAFNLNTEKIAWADNFKVIYDEIRKIGTRLKISENEITQLSAVASYLACRTFPVECLRVRKTSQGLPNG